MLPTHMRAETLRCDVKKPKILDDVQQAPDEELSFLVRTPRSEIFASTPCHRNEPSEIRQALLAAIEDQHNQLCMQIDKNRKVLRAHIGTLMWPCQQASSDSMKGSDPPDTCCTAKANAQLDSSEVFDPPQITQSTDFLSERAPEPISPDDGCATADQTGLWTNPNEGVVSKCHKSSSLERLQTQTIKVVQRVVCCGQFESRFDSAVCLLIILNIVVITLQLQWEGHKASVTLGLNEESSEWDGAMPLFDALEHAFAIVFLLELLIRIRARRFKYFADSANFFDAFLVFSSMIELYVLTPLGKTSGMNLTVLRIIRLCKIVRVLRVVRVMKLFMSLHIIGSAIIRSMSSLFWSIVVLFIVILMGGLFMSQSLSEYIADDREPLNTRNWAYTYYGGSARATLTMFEITLSGCWPNYSRRLVEEVSAWYVLFFIFYIAGVVFAVTRIITAIFLRDTLQAADSESDRVIIELQHTRRDLMRQLEDFFKEADKSSDGLVDRDEFEQMLQKPNVRLWLRSMGLVVNEYVALFNLIDSGSGSISFQEFMDGVQRLKGNARSIDMLGISLEMGRVRQTLSELEKWLHKVIGEADARELKFDDRDMSNLRRDCLEDGVGTS